ncbi:MAG: alpha/beta hydrolase [Clostridia bacterium]
MNDKKLISKKCYWKGFKAQKFVFEEKQAIIVFPKLNAQKKLFVGNAICKKKCCKKSCEATANGVVESMTNTNCAKQAWVWRTEFFGAFDSVDIAMLKNGFCLVNLAISDLFGAPCATEIMERFQQYITSEFGLSEKAILIGLSRGGLYALHYAAKCARNVSALYLDAPVVDLKSWPFGLGKGVGSELDKGLSLKAFGYSSVEQYQDYLNATMLALSKEKLPLVLVAGDSDKVVPYIENGILLEELWTKIAAPLKVIIKKGCDHHPHSLADPAPIVEFLMTNKL